MVDNAAYQQIRALVRAAKVELEGRLRAGTVRPALDPTGDVFETSFSLTMLARPLRWATAVLVLLSIVTWVGATGEPGSYRAPAVISVVALACAIGSWVLWRRLALFGDWDVRQR